MRYAVEGTPGAALLDGLHVEPSDLVIAKSRFSAFHDTELDNWLNRLQCSRVILAGITTAWCVRSTAVDAYQRDLDVILASDCMAAFDVQSHKESLAAMDGYVARSMSTPKIAAALTDPGDDF
jgi:nicotinamidase-related amidase